METRIQRNRRNGRSETEEEKETVRPKERLIDGAVLFVLLVSFGFPGKYTMLIGTASSKLFEYAAFAVQIFIMLFSSGDDGVMSLKIIDIKEKYAAIYLMAIVYFVDSMLVTRYPSEQLISCIRYTATILFALWMTEYYDTEKILHLIAAAQLIFTVLTLGFILLKPGAVFAKEQGEHDFTGIMRTKNNAASQFSVCILLQIVWFRILRAKHMIVSRRYLVSMALQGILLFLCNARGAVLCLILPVIYVLFGTYDQKPSKRLPVGVIYISLSILFIVTALTILPLFEPLFAMIGKNTTLTGRVPLWRQIIQVMMNRHTFTGYGYGMFWRDRQAVAQIHQAFSRNSFMGSMTTGAHNVLIELWLNVGLFGVAAYFTALLITTAKADQMEWTHYILSAAYILWFMMFGWTERSMSTYEYQTLFLFIAMGAACHKIRPEPERRRKYA